MKRRLILCIWIILLPTIMAGSSLTDVDYTLGGSKNGKGHAGITEEDSYQGPHSIGLYVVPEKGKYARIYVNYDHPLPIEDLDQLSMWLKPNRGSGRLTLDIYFDSGRKISSSKSWSDNDLGKWQELDAFDLNFGDRSLRECQKDLSGNGIKKIWIRLYNNGSDEVSAYLDYLKIRDQVISFEPLEKENVLDAPSSASPGGKITYIITYGNNQLLPIDLVVENLYDPGIVFQEADPAPDPGTNNIWTIRNLSPGKYGQIRIITRTHKLSCKAEITGSVSGIGLASVSREMSTDQPSYQVTNTVTLSSSKFRISAIAGTKIKAVDGAVIGFSEHGSGAYSSDEILSYSSSKISMKQDLRSNGTFALVNVSGRSLNYNSSWYAHHICENRITKTSLNEKYLHANKLNLSGDAGIRKKETWMATEANYSGIAEYDSRGKSRTVNEMFVGSFKAKNREIEWYNSSSKYPDKSWLDCCSGETQYQSEEDIEYENWTMQDIQLA